MKQSILGMAELTIANALRRSRQQRRARWVERAIMEAMKNFSEEIIAQNYTSDRSYGMDRTGQDRTVLKMVTGKVLLFEKQMRVLSRFLAAQVSKAGNNIIVENSENIWYRLSLQSSCAPSPVSLNNDLLKDLSAKSRKGTHRRCNSEQNITEECASYCNDQMIRYKQIDYQTGQVIGQKH